MHSSDKMEQIELPEERPRTRGRRKRAKPPRRLKSDSQPGIRHSVAFHGYGFDYWRTPTVRPLSPLSLPRSLSLSLSQYERGTYYSAGTTDEWKARDLKAGWGSRRECLVAK